MKTKFLIMCLCSCFTHSLKAQTLYFPTTTPSGNWDTISPSSLGWCIDKVDSLYSYLGQENTKGFILLKDGKIVLEKYFGNFTKDSNWYWASAGKTITSFLIGQAQEDGFLTIQDKSSDYLLNGWTNCSSTQEDSILIKNQLSMTSGLDDGVIDNHCTIDTCLNYLAPSNTRWAYHNAPYTLLEKVIENASGQTINTYTNLKIKSPIGMNGIWYTVGFDNVFFSTARSMARFGLLIQNNGIWNNDTLLQNVLYKTQMINSSQNLNLSYGYLWWLNGKASYMVPTLQTVFPGSYAPDAPNDMIAGIGKNGQIVSISKSKGLVMIRMGDSPSSAGSEVPFLLCTTIWKKLNDIMCNAASASNYSQLTENPVIYPNPAHNMLHINLNKDFTCSIFTIHGKLVRQYSNQNQLDISSIKKGIYYIQICDEHNIWMEKLVVE